MAGLLGLPAVPPLDRGWIHGVGIVLAAVGVVGTFLTEQGMGGSWRVGVDEGERTALVPAGAFALVGNPFFTATLVTGAGLALIVPNAVAILGSARAIELRVKASRNPPCVASTASVTRPTGPRWADSYRALASNEPPADQAHVPDLVWHGDSG